MLGLKVAYGHETNYTNQHNELIKEHVDGFNYLEQGCIKKEIPNKYCQTIMFFIDEFDIPYNHEGVPILAGLLSLIDSVI